ncbi:MAG: NAD(P)/FAD-dependent oxidoreductase [Saprospiraceae bacterium]|nr:NAD(P)/FAD-dependent oxidoreductase [Saprospiraceae bacterium]NNL92159.1 NAD(P)/FAD-dependent oxidoreductase [Saprospiraceae bacterium]
MLNIPDSPHPRIVIIGAGFAGFNLAKKLRKKDFQVVLIDKFNYHQFQPLFYQVAMAGLEPTSIIFPLRKAFQGSPNVHIRIAKVTKIKDEEKRIDTTLGEIYYDQLIIATGATTNYFGNEDFKKFTSPLKSLSEALALRNEILSDFEQALMTPEYEERQGFIDIVIVGGGPTGVELAGSLAEMRKYILPKDYPELDEKEVDIYLFQGGSRLLMGMSDHAGKKALSFLRKLGVKVELNKRVTGFDGTFVTTKDGQKIRAHKVIWAAGIKGNCLDGLSNCEIARGNRYLVDEQHKLKDFKDIFALGDIAYMKTEKYPNGHPQVAQVAIQQSNNLAKNLIKNKSNAFVYKDLGSMATIGRNKAVCDLPRMKFSGFFAWLLWLFVHLMSLIGFKNKIFVMLNWMWNYMTYDQSLRVIINTKEKPNSTRIQKT